MNFLVTGGASGLGEAITRRLAADGRNKVYFTWATSSSNADVLTRSLSNTEAIQCDFRSEADVSHLVNRIAQLGLQGLVNNAMTGMTLERFHKLPPDHFARSFDENIVPVMRITQAAIRHFREERFGKIVTVLTSYLACAPPLGLSAYVSMKAYLHSMAKSWAVENNRFNITSNCVSPSFMRTGLTKDTDERVIAQLTGKHPLERLLAPEETAAAVAFLMESSQQINGVNLLINAAEHTI